MKLKYEILKDDDNTIDRARWLADGGYFECKTLYRIRALKDFGDVKEGDLGGYVKSEGSLSQEGNCWIYDNSLVYDNATVKDNAVVRNNAWVRGNVTVQGDFEICTEGILEGDGIYGSEDDKADDSEDDQAAERYNDGKLQWSLVDFECLEPLVKALEYGENKYSSFNWKKGMKQTKIIESLLRHTFAYLGGEDNDTESGVSHIGHIMSNAMFLANSAKSPEWDDRFKGI